MLMLYWRFVRKSPWNEDLQCYESEQDAVEIDLYNPFTDEVVCQLWQPTLPLAEQSINDYYPGVKYSRVQGFAPGATSSWSGRTN